MLKVLLSHYFFSHICELDCAKAWPFFISCSLSSSLELQPVLPLSRPFRATQTAGCRSVTQGLVSLTLIFTQRISQPRQEDKFQKLRLSSPTLLQLFPTQALSSHTLTQTKLCFPALNFQSPHAGRHSRERQGQNVICKKVYSYITHEFFLFFSSFLFVPVTASFQHLQQMTQGLASREQTHSICNSDSFLN